jgi:hypothetical protein
MLPGVTDATNNPASLIAAVQAELRGRLGAIASSDFVETHRNMAAIKNGARLQFVTLRQTVGGVPVDDTYLHIGIRFDAKGARLVSSSYRLFENIPVDTHAAIPHDRAVVLAQKGLRMRTAVAPSTGDLVVHKLDGRLQLAWSFTFPGTYKRAFVVASGAEQGRVMSVDERRYDSAGTITGSPVHGGAPGGLGVPTPSGLPDTTVTGGATSVTADATGAYSIGVPNGTALTASLNGKASAVSDQNTGTLSATGTANGAGTNLTFASTTEDNLAQITAYYFVDQVRAFLEANGMDPALFGSPLPTLTNEDDICNAFYDPGARDINFFRSGGGCNNSAIDTVIAHEYGHFVDDFNGGIIDGGLSEGWGDTLACLWSKQSTVGFDLFPGSAIRDCQNDYVYPPGGNDEVHNLGQAWAGFNWDVRTNLIAALGPVDGDALARALILPSFQSNAPDIPTGVREVFLRDDDDGDLSNHTPHWDALIAAANHHGLAFAVDPDLTPPAPVTDLTISSTQATQIGITWTATGDDGNEGVAAAYDLRWSTQPITPDNFAAATQIPTNPPQPPGSTETTTAIVPPSTTVFVAIEVLDEQFNVSTLSNVASVMTTGGTTVFQEGAEGDTSGWTTSGLWHVTTTRASEGTHSFWYGQESTGNYDNGLPNSGDLTSPLIDLTSVTAPILVFDQFINVEPDPFDLAQVIITDADDPNHTTNLPKDTFFSNGAFAPRVVPLTGFDGKRIHLTYHFDTLDEIANDTDGWLIDNIRIIGSDSGCAHGLCDTGSALDPDCSPCVASVCEFDSFCCVVAWDAVCVAESQQTCGTTCTTCGNGICEAGETPQNCPQDCQPACAHDTCDPGVALDPACDSCASAVCGEDPFCCTIFWDRVCVQEVETTCGKQCEGCSHDFCNVGGPLTDNCDPCAASVCASDPFCCAQQWDTRCVQEAANGCGLQCSVCSHDLCAQGTPLETGCDPCVSAVCASDPYCCANTWDQRCIDESQTTCGLACAASRDGGTAPSGDRRAPSGRQTR